MYQLSFEDVERSNSLALQPGRTAYIDECGNFGFEFEKEGTSLYYIICAVIVKNENIKTIEASINKIRLENGFQNSEMKSSLIGNKHGRRVKILTEILALDYSLIVLIADKKEFYKSPLTDYKGTFIKYLHQKLYDTMYAAFPKLQIIEDEYGGSEFQLGYRKYIYDHRPVENLLNEYDFDYVNSKHSPIVQLADIVSGSISYFLLDDTAPNALNILQGKVRGIINFPNNYPPCFAGTNPDKKLDEEIYALADHCATIYIDAHRHTDNPDIRLHISLLEYLFFVVRNVNPYKFVSSPEIVKVLSAFSDKKISRDFLYRRIIAPLRDAGVIIASCTQGYKIPTCMDDIYLYANQTNTIVGPMLSRVDKCRELVLKQTDGRFDIFDDPALTKYKGYFGDY